MLHGYSCADHRVDDTWLRHYQCPQLKLQNHFGSCPVQLAFEASSRAHARSRKCSGTPRSIRSTLQSRTEQRLPCILRRTCKTRTRARCYRWGLHSTDLFSRSKRHTTHVCTKGHAQRIYSTTCQCKTQHERKQHLHTILACAFRNAFGDAGIRSAEVVWLLLAVSIVLRSHVDVAAGGIGEGQVADRAATLWLRTAGSLGHAETTSVCIVGVPANGNTAIHAVIAAIEGATADYTFERSAIGDDISSERSISMHHS